jgi:hydrogenase expression/formation protein HypC
MCLAIPARVVELTDERNRIALVDVAGVRRTVNVGLLHEGASRIAAGDWVLVHVGFAISKIDEDEAEATRRLLERMGAEYEQELAELKASAIE